MRALRTVISRVAASDATVLITGESGTGKELVAHALHLESGRGGAFVPIHCAAIPAELLDAELFGHARGAFTGAVGARRGLLREANDGTLFLDEVGGMPLAMQAKLLRVLQERRFRPVGSHVESTFRGRVIAATNRDLAADVEAGTFRADLYYRLHVIVIPVPPLREHLGDIPALVKEFIARSGDRGAELAPGARTALSTHGWPGNARELESAVNHALMVRTTATIELADLPSHLRASGERWSPTRGLPYDEADVVTLDVLETTYLHHVLALVDGNKARAARLLGVDRRTLYRKLGRSSADLELAGRATST